MSPRPRRGEGKGSRAAGAEGPVRDAVPEPPVLVGEAPDSSNTAKATAAARPSTLDTLGKASPETHERPLDLLIARIGTEFFGFPVGGVEEIIEIGELRALPEGDTSLAGVCAVRGRLLPIHRPTAVLGELSEPQVGLALVLRVGNRTVGIAVDDAEEVIGVTTAQMRRPPARGIDERLVRGVVLHEGRILTLLDTEALAARFADAPGAEQA